jgi:glycosyltransferase involved in cell wall biosynthesis
VWNVQGTLGCSQYPLLFRYFAGSRLCLNCNRQLSTAMAQITPAFEIIFVEDGGGDPSWAIIAGLAHDDHRVLSIRMSRNYGRHSALLCGIRAARQEVVITMDDDLQHPASEIPFAERFPAPDITLQWSPFGPAWSTPP